MNRIRRFLIAAIIVLIAFAVSNIQPTKAIGLWTMSDDLEGSTNWIFTGTGGTGQRVTSTTVALLHSGTHFIRLTSLTGQPNKWFSAGRTVHITPFAPGRTLSCQASIWIRGSFAGCPGSAPAACTTTFWGGVGNFEIIDPATWGYVSLKPFTVAPGDSYKSFKTSTWNPPAQDVFVRVSLFGNNDEAMTAIAVDDLAVVCTYL